MNQHGRRFLSTHQFRWHASALKVSALFDQELEFYEEHCLLLPAARTHKPPAHAIAETQESLGAPVTNRDDLKPPAEWKRLRWEATDGVHAFDAERDRNPLLVTPDCSTFEPWHENRVPVALEDGRTLQHPTVERYYAPWQVHIVESLRQRKYYYAHRHFLRHLDPSHDLWRVHRPPQDTWPLRSLQGMAAGLDALERFRFAEQDAWLEASTGVPQGESLPEQAHARLDVALSRRALRSLESSGLDEQAFFEFLSKLVALALNYRIDERIALAEDAERYIEDAQELAYHAFGHDQDGFLDAARDHAGPALVTELQRLDPVAAAAQGARQNLDSILGQDPGLTIASTLGLRESAAGEIVRFCLDHDLLEVLSSLQRYSFTADDRRSDPFPGFLNRRLRPLALAGEQLLRGIWEAAAGAQGDEDSPWHQGKKYHSLMEALGAEALWLPIFQKLASTSHTSDKDGELEERALSLARSVPDADAGSPEAIASTLVVAVAARNLVSHRHRFLSAQTVRTLGGPCADAVVLIWLLARGRGLV